MPPHLTSLRFDSGRGLRLSLHYRQHGSAIVIIGNTYAYRDQLKTLGARYNGSERNWRVPFTPANLASVAELCTQVGGGSLGTAPSEELTLPQSSPLPAIAEHTRAILEGTQSADPSLTIRQLMEQVDLAVCQAFPQTVWVTGEVQNLSRKGTGIFFDLAEARTGAHANATVTVRSIIWSNALTAMQTRRGADKLAEVLQEGLQLRCLCQVQLYKDRGSITLLISDIDPTFTKGALALARERLLKELRAKGLDQANKRLELPPFPLRIGLISADGSRAKSDFLDQLDCLDYPGEVLFCAATMQGEQVPRQVVAALTLLIKHGCDLVVITRGGGSAADLRWFDAPEIAYAIAAASIPVIAAIGHHDDVCVAEEICHLRQKTPTAAADFVVSICLDTRARIDSVAAGLANMLGQRLSEISLLSAALVGRLHAAAERALDSRSLMLTQLGNHLQRTATSRITATMSVLSDLKAKFNVSAERRLGGFATRLAEILGELQRRDPTSWLSQGWTRLSGAKGPITSCSQVAVGEAVKARLADGWLNLSVQETVARSHPQKETHTSEASP